MGNGYHVKWFTVNVSLRNLTVSFSFALTHTVVQKTGFNNQAYLPSFLSLN